MLCWICVHEQDRVGVAVALAAAHLALVGTEEQDRRLVREQESRRIGGGREPRVWSGPLVRLLDASAEGEEARGAPHDEEDEQQDDPDPDLPAARELAPGRVRPAVLDRPAR